MKKEEARKLLDNTKVYVNGKSEEIQKKLFEIGYKWYNGGKTILYIGEPFLFMSADGDLTWGSSMNYFQNNESKEVSADFILDINIDKSKYHFKPFDKVLAFDKVWRPMLYGFQNEDKVYFASLAMVPNDKAIIIPYNEKTAYLVGTSKEYEE